MALIVCRAVKVLCVAPDRDALRALKVATVSADWELTAGALDGPSALRQLEDERPHMMVVFGPFEALVSSVAARFPNMRIVVDRDAPGATAVATSAEEVRGLLEGVPRPGGPVR